MNYTELIIQEKRNRRDKGCTPEFVVRLGNDSWSDFKAGLHAMFYNIELHDTTQLNYMGVIVKLDKRLKKENCII